MNIVNFDDQSFKNTQTYNNFLNNNPTTANLNIRASSANEALPISNVRIIVSKDIDNYKVIFFDGYTDTSGMINRIELPTPSRISNDLDVPQGTLYDIEAIYTPDNLDRKYKILMYPDICMVQNINIVPSLSVSSFISAVGDINGS